MNYDVLNFQSHFRIFHDFMLDADEVNDHLIR